LPFKHFKRLIGRHEKTQT